MSETMQKLIGTISLAVIAVCSASLIAGCDPDKAYAVKVTKASVQIPAIFKEFEYRETIGKPQTSDVVWSGQDSKILIISAPRTFAELVDSGSIKPEFTEWSVLAKTSTSGRYFLVDYKLTRSPALLYWLGYCVDIERCVMPSGFKPLSESEAKEEVFRNGNAELYRDLFNSKMPPREIKA